MNHGRWIRRVVTLIPEQLAAAPERVLVNTACVIIGVTSILGDEPGRLHGLWDDGLIVTWAIGMIVGGSAALIGYWNYPQRPWSRPVERLGYLVLCVSCAIYGVGLVYVFGWRGTFLGILFLGIAFSKLVRLLVTSAYRSYLLEHRDDRDVP